MKSSQKQLTELQVINSLRNARDFFEAQPKMIYSSKINPFTDTDTGFVFNTTDDLLNSLHEIGIHGKTIKEAGLELEEVYELLSQTQETITEFPEYSDPTLTKTTFNKNESAHLIEEAEKREKQQAEIREKSKREVEQGLKTKEEIAKRQKTSPTQPESKTRYEEIENEQKQIESDIQEAQNVQKELENKKIYAKITVPAIPELTQEEKQDLQILEDFAKDPKTRTQLIEDLTQEIEGRIKPTLKEATENEIRIIARTSAVDIVEKIASPEARQKALEENIQTAVYQSLTTNPKVIKEVVKEAKPLQALEKGSVVLAYYANKQNATTQIIAGNLFDSKFKRIFYGPNFKEIRVEYSEKLIQGQTNYIVDIGSVNSEFINLQQKSNTLLEKLKSFGIEESRSYISTQVGIYFKEKVATMPESVVKKVYSSPVLQSFLSKYGIAEPVVWQSIGQNQVVGILMKVAPETAGPVLSIAGNALGINIVKPVATKVAGQVAGKVATQAAGKATGASLGATIGTITGLSGGPLVVVTATIGALIGEFISKVGSKFKVWWSKNKENIAPFLAVGAGLSLARFGIGPAILGGAGTFLMFGGTASALLFGPLRFFAILGRNIGITIATPVIVTLLIIPPLVVFIMLVINNSAYVVPPSLNSLSKTMDLITIPPGGNLKKCDPNETGEDITEQLAGSITAAGVYLLPDWIPSRRQGICMKPTMIILHTSGGYDNDNGNSATYETIVAAANTKYPTSAHLATDTDNTIFMLSFFENEVEFGWHANNLNEGGIGIEMAGEYQGTHGPHSKCSPEGSLTYTPNGPHPCPPLEDLAFNAVCKIMQKYSIPWSQVYQHEQSNGNHIDPVGDAWSDKFILRIRDNCPIKAFDNLR